MSVCGRGESGDSLEVLVEIARIVKTDGHGNLVNSHATGIIF